MKSHNQYPCSSMNSSPYQSPYHTKDLCDCLYNNSADCSFSKGYICESDCNINKYKSIYCRDLRDLIDVNIIPQRTNYRLIFSHKPLYKYRWPC